MNASKIFVAILLGTLPLSAMQTTTKQEKTKTYEWERFDLYSSILFPKDKDHENDTRIQSASHDNYVEFQIHERSFWGKWDIEKYHYAIPKLSVLGKLTGISSQGIHRITKTTYLGAFIINLLKKDGENVKEEEACLVAKFDAITKNVSQLTYPAAGKIMKLKFAINRSTSEAKLTLYSRNKDLLGKVQSVFNCETFAPVQDPQLIKQWKMVQG